MAQVPTNPNLHDSGGSADRRRGGPVNLIRRAVITLVHNRWVAMFIVAFAVSWSFHEFDEQQDKKFEQQQRVMQCTIQGVADAQTQDGPRTLVGPILEACEKQEGK